MADYGYLFNSGCVTNVPFFPIILLMRSEHLTEGIPMSALRPSGQFGTGFESLSTYHELCQNSTGLEIIEQGIQEAPVVIKRAANATAIGEF
jgi:hypothetical protein